LAAIAHNARYKSLFAETVLVIYAVFSALYLSSHNACFIIFQTASIFDAVLLFHDISVTVTSHLSVHNVVIFLLIQSIDLSFASHSILSNIVLGVPESSTHIIFHSLYI